MPQDKNLTVITICLYQTQGDSSAALKLIQGIIRSNEGQQQKIKVTWIFAVQNTNLDWPFYESFIHLARQIGVKVIFTDQRMSDLNAQAYELYNTDFFLYFPYVLAIPPHIELLIKTLGKPILNIGEYNLDQVAGALKTGFGARRLGVFVEDSTDPNRHMLTVCKDIALVKLGLIDAQTGTVGPQEIARYKSEHTLFFGYFNKEFIRCHNHPVVNPENFITICLYLATKKKAKNVDLVVRFGCTVENLPLHLLANDYSSIESITRDGQASITHLNIDQNLPKVRIIDPFPLEHDAFKLLMSIAEPFMALTGDQSFTEGINRAGIIFYQVMDWKQRLAGSFIELCSDVPHAKELHEFNDQVLSIKPNYLDSLCVTLAEFIFFHEAKLIEQMQAVKQKVHRTYNLLENLIPRLRQAVLNQDSMDRVLGDYIHREIPEAKKPAMIFYMKHILEKLENTNVCKTTNHFPEHHVNFIHKINNVNYYS